MIAGARMMNRMMLISIRRPARASSSISATSIRSSTSRWTAALYPSIPSQHEQYVRWMATKRQKRVAAAAAATESSRDTTTGGASDKSTTTASGGGDTTSATTTTSTTSPSEKKNPSTTTGIGIASQQQQPPPPTLWLPPTDTKRIEEAFRQQQQQQQQQTNHHHSSLESSTSLLKASSPSASSLSSSSSPFEFQDHYRQIYNPQIHLASAPTDWTAEGYEAATPLWHDLAALIGVSGRPISVADYMRQCLTHPEHGYYTRAESSGATSRSSARTAAANAQEENEEELDDFDIDEWDDDEATSAKNNVYDDDGLIIGPSGDFVTAPEMSQIFGECLAIWFMTVWQQKQQRGGNVSAAWQWLEFGPGTGALMSDLVRFCFYGSDKIRNTFGGSNCRAIHFIEQSPRLRQVQKKALESVHQHAIRRPGEEEEEKAAKRRIVEFEFHDNTSSDDNEANNNVDKKKNDATNKDDIHRLPVYWHDSLAHFHAWQEKNQSYLPTNVVCQEFMDALPVYAFEKTAKEGWRERMVDIALREDMMESALGDSNNDAADSSKQLQHQQSQKTSAAASGTVSNIKKPRLRIVLAPEVTPAARTLLGVKGGGGSGNDDIIDLLPNEDPPAPVGSVVEVNPEAILLAQDLARLIDRQGGAAIIIDYGPEHGSRDSIRAFSKHEQVHFLSQPGLVDITADVDFAALKHAVNQIHDDSSAKNGANTQATTGTATKAFGPVPQGNFLMAMGANERAMQLIENDNTTEEEAENVYQALVRLCAPEEMGLSYLCLAIAPDSNNQQPPGF